MGKLLFFQWRSFLNEGIEKALKNLEIEYEKFFYELTDWEQDEKLLNQLEQVLTHGSKADGKEAGFEMVLSVNYCSLIAKVCFEKGIPYASWIYDSPIHIRDTSSMKYHTNYIFSFDRGEVLQYKQAGYNAYHLPLAADPSWFGKQYSSAAERKKYSADVSMVGQLYGTEYSYYMAPLTQYQKGYLEGIVKAQMQVYGAYFLPELLTDELLKGLNESYHAVSKGKVSVTREELKYLLSCEITSRERYLALALLSKHFDVKHYAKAKDDRLSNVTFMGYADYTTQMPKVFENSLVNLNISLKTITTGIPLRVLDIMACGGFVISNYQEELAEYFQVGEEVVLYGDLEELYDLTEYYLTHEEELKAVAVKGYERVKSDFTFEKAVKTILDTVKR